MITDEQKKIIFDFLKGELLGVVGTVNKEGKPEAAVMAITGTKELELIFQTPNTSRKYLNLKANPSIAVAFGWDLEKFITVQYEGIATEVLEEDMNKVREIHLAKQPYSKEYANIPENKYFLVKPKWIRYWDIKRDYKFEITFD